MNYSVRLLHPLLLQAACVAPLLGSRDCISLKTLLVLVAAFGITAPSQR
jgi:hypothetical protein